MPLVEIAPTHTDRFHPKQHVVGPDFRYGDLA
jgi:hypothetical protein